MATTYTNNVGKTTETLPTTIGETLSISSGDVGVGTVTMTSGTINLGCIIFDDAGTMAVCTTITANTSTSETIYGFETTATSSETKVLELLSGSY